MMDKTSFVKIEFVLCEFWCIFLRKMIQYQLFVFRVVVDLMTVVVEF